MKRYRNIQTVLRKAKMTEINEHPVTTFDAGSSEVYGYIPRPLGTKRGTGREGVGHRYVHPNLFCDYEL